MVPGLGVSEESGSSVLEKLELSHPAGTDTTEEGATVIKTEGLGGVDQSFSSRGAREGRGGRRRF